MKGLKIFLLSFLIINGWVFGSTGYELSKDIYKNYSNSILLISNEEDQVSASSQKNQRIISFGTAFAIDKSGLLLTSAHLVKDSSIIKDSAGNIFPVLDIPWKNDDIDLALIKIAGHFKPIPLGDSSKTEVGEEIMVISNPSGFQNTLSRGIVSARRKQGKFDYIQHTSAISPGSSGGPIFDEDGNVIAIIQGIYASPNAQNLNFAIPVNYLPEKYLKLNKAQTQTEPKIQAESNNNYFKLLEGLNSANYLEAYILRGLLKNKLKDYSGALVEFQTAQSFLQVQVDKNKKAN